MKVYKVLTCIPVFTCIVEYFMGVLHFVTHPLYPSFLDSFLHIVWSDPDDVHSWAMSPRGAGWLFGAKVTNEVRTLLFVLLYFVEAH